jgi:hypothetical protein
LHLFHLLLAIALLAPNAAAAEPLADAASALVDSLSEDQRRDAIWDFGSAERLDVHYAPFGLDGIRQDELSVESQNLAEAVLAVALSPEGHQRTRSIRDLERDVAAAEAERFWGFAVSWMRSPGRYFWAFFDPPQEARPWGFRLEGHHLSINVSAIPGTPAASTPLFLGAQPRVVPDGLPSAGVAALGEEERLARELYASLSGPQRALATLSFDGDRGHMLGQVGRIDAPDPVGVPRSALRPAQQVTLDALVDRFAAFFGGDIAAARRSEIASARTALRFAHVEANDPPNAFYTRVSAPSLLIEIDNTSDGDHIHAVWHQPGRDFGDDLLARHWRTEHGLALNR